MNLRDVYDLPRDLTATKRSPAFDQFLRNWFEDERQLRRGELDLGFLSRLSPEELEVARGLIRRNLKLRFVHIINGAVFLRDLSAVPLLKAMLDTEPDWDRGMEIAGALWQLTRDSVFVERLHQLKANNQLHGIHMLKILWLDDERALDFLVDLLNRVDRELKPSFQHARASPIARLFGLLKPPAPRMDNGATGRRALSMLNDLEFGRLLVPVQDLPMQPKDYRVRRNDPAFRATMVRAIHKWNADNHLGL
jgi:hypothetical protein